MRELGIDTDHPKPDIYDGGYLSSFPAYHPPPVIHQPSTSPGPSSLQPSSCPRVLPDMRGQAQAQGS